MENLDIEEVSFSFLMKSCFVHFGPHFALFINSLQVLLYLQLHKKVSVFFLDSWQDVTDYVCAVTKALSKRPFK